MWKALLFNLTQELFPKGLLIAANPPLYLSTLVPLGNLINQSLNRNDPTPLPV